MYCVDLTRQTNGRGHFNFYPIGDLHLDDTGFNEVRCKRYIAHIANDPQAIAVYVGDTVNGTTPGHKHFEAGAVRKKFLTNMDRYVTFALDCAESLLQPLKEAGVPVATVQGNHDMRMEWSGFSWALAQRLGFAYLGDGGFVRCRTGTTRRGTSGLYTTTVFATHGSGGGRRPGGKVNDMQQTIEAVQADVIVKGHLHDASVRIVDRYGIPASGALELERRSVALLRAPAFLETIQNHTGYATREGYGLSDRTLSYLHVRPMEHGMFARMLEF